MSFQRVIGPTLAVFVALGVGFGIWQSNQQKTEHEQQVQPAAIDDLRIVSGSESLAYLTDPRFTAILLQQGLRLSVQKSGSREMALRNDLKTFDAAFPSGVEAAEKIQAVTGASQRVATFFTPMVIASWKPLMPVLSANGLVQQRGEHWFLTDMPKLMRLMEQGTRWRDLKNNTVFAVSKSLLVSTTDVRKSNSAGQYLALTSWIANDSNVVTSDEEIERVSPRLLPLFLKQGYQENTSSGPFENYLSMGMGAVPLVLIYESQFFESALKDQSISPDMLVLYPEPSLYSRRILVPFNSKGEKLAQLLSTNPELQQLAAEYGMRGTNPQLLAAVLKRKGLAPAPQLNEIVGTPSFEILEKMIRKIEQKLN